MASTPKQQVQEMLAAAAATADDRKAEDIRILALDPAESGLTDYFLICSGNSDRQNIAITDAIELRLKHDFATYPTSVEGRRVGEWIIMDYVDFIVHVFSAEKRAYYGLDRLRKTATSLTVADLDAEIKAAITASRKPKAKSSTTAPAKAATSTAAIAQKKAVGKKTLPPVSTAKRATARKSPAKKAIAKKPPTKPVAKKKSVVKKSPSKGAARKNR
jgi:ribosome-associated protein